MRVNSDLPIAREKENIVELIRSNQVLIVVGETGSGKTTQLPKILLQTGIGSNGAIVHTQPRRIAAISIAKRIAQEMGANLGKEIGYSIRFDDRSSSGALLKLVTDGLLLNELRTDRYLNKYSGLIIDEAHERSLNIDLLLGYVKEVIKRRPEFRVIVTSATISGEQFSRFFDGAPIIDVAGRSYPISIQYCEPKEELLEQIVDLIKEIERQKSKLAPDILVFFPGAREISDAVEFLRKRFAGQLEVLALYSRLSQSDQLRVFERKSSKRRVILTTNIAETSVTVPGIGFVIDLGLARVNRFSQRSKIQRLVTEEISQANADQRAGRCGRLGPGICYRLYTEEVYQNKPLFPDPEIMRVNLASVLIQMRFLGLGEPQNFAFIDPPEKAALDSAQKLLIELRATKRKELTKLGRKIARFPMDPRLAASLISAPDFGSLTELLTLVSFLSLQDIRERPIEHAHKADEAHQKFVDARSDFLTILKMWDWIETLKREESKSSFKKTLKKNFLNFRRTVEWSETRDQLARICKTLGLKANTDKASYRAIHLPMIIGNLSNLARLKDRTQYQGARNQSLMIFPGSGLFKKKHAWIVSTEIIETSRIYARDAASIRPSWVEQCSKHLQKERFDDPHWSKKRGEVMGYQTVSLYGLVLAEKRRKPLGNKDPKLCREIFLDALVAGELLKVRSFVLENKKLLEEVQGVEDKTRVGGKGVNESDLLKFYDSKIPEEIISESQLARWLNEIEPNVLRELYLDREDALTKLGGLPSAELFPDHLVTGGISFALRYRFAPGESDDGVTMEVPIGLLSAVSDEDLNWPIPAFLSPTLESLLRSLPREFRRKLQPMEESVDLLISQIHSRKMYRRGRFIGAIVEIINDLFGWHLADSNFDQNRVGFELRTGVRVLDEKNKEICFSKDLKEIKDSLYSTKGSGGNKEKQQQGASDFEELGLTRFPDRKLEEQLLVQTDVGPKLFFPGLMSRVESLNLVLFDDKVERDREVRRAFSCLALNYFESQREKINRLVKANKSASLYYSTLGSIGDLQDLLSLATSWFCFFEDQELPNNRQSFEKRLQDRKGDLLPIFDAVFASFETSLRLRHEIMAFVEQLDSPKLEETKRDLVSHVERLFPPTLLTNAPRRYLVAIPRYLYGVQYRLERLNGRVLKDRKMFKDLQVLQARFDHLVLSSPERGMAFGTVRMFLEELRLRTFCEGGERRFVDATSRDSEAASWKVSQKKVSELMLQEERKAGLL